MARLGPARPGEARLGAARLGVARRGRGIGLARLGTVRRGWDRRGWFGSGAVRQGRCSQRQRLHSGAAVRCEEHHYGAAGLDRAGQGAVGRACLGPAWHVGAW